MREGRRRLRLAWDRNGGVNQARRALRLLRKFDPAAEKVGAIFDTLLGMLKDRLRNPPGTRCEVRLFVCGKAVTLDGDEVKNTRRGVAELGRAVQKISEEHLARSSTGEEEIVLALASLAELLRINEPGQIESVTALCTELPSPVPSRRCRRRERPAMVH